MPMESCRAYRLIKKGEATPFFRLGIFSIRLNKETQTNIQSTVLCVDPGSKKEGYTIKSAAHTYINIQADALTGVKDKIEVRRNMRRGRRFRNTPCRKPRWANRGASLRSDRVPPSTKARYDWKIFITNKLSSIYPISGVGVEDIKAQTKQGQRRWNISFSPLEVGKKYYYESLRRNGFRVKLNSGYSTSIARKSLGLNKTEDKLSNQFDAHCVDSWVMANEAVGGHSVPDNRDVLYISPINFYRRQLHVFQFAKGSMRKRFGGTRSLGFKKGSVVRYQGKSKPKVKNGKFYLVGGFDDNKITLCALSSQSDRLSRAISPGDCKFVAYNRFTIL